MMENPTILCIDDDEQIRYTFDQLFQFQGWTSITAASVEEGLRMFRQERPDIVLIDYHMPVINGVEGVSRLRKMSDSVPIIVFTIDESQAVADAFLAAGASDFALKPIKAPDILSRIKLHLQLLSSIDNAQTKPRSEVAKGMSRGTLDLIESTLKKQAQHVTANEIADQSGLAYQTVYRYLQHLAAEEKVELVNVYGKVGRPKQLYLWKGE